MKKIKIKNKKTYIILGIILFFVTISLSFGRYVYYGVKDMYLRSKKFYFNSDKLTQTRRIYKMDNYSGVDTYNFTINLNNSKNNLEHANSDIDYEVTYVCSDNANCSVSKTNGTIYTDQISDTFTANISPKTALKNKDEVWIEITAKSTFPYKKTLSARFILQVGIPGISYQISDEVGSPYFNFTVTNTTDYYLIKENFGVYEVNQRIDHETYMSLSETDKLKCALPLISLKFDPSVVIMDMTSSVFQKKESFLTTTIGSYEYINQISFRIDPESSELIKFYKSNTKKDYTYPITNDVSVIEFNYTQ